MFMRKDVNESFEKAFGFSFDEEKKEVASLNESVTKPVNEDADLDNAYSKLLKFFEGKDTKEVVDNLMALVSDVLGKDSMNKLIMDVGVRIDKEKK